MPWVRVLRNCTLFPAGGYCVDIPNRALGPWCATISEAFILIPIGIHGSVSIPAQCGM